jgi:hypothetical protein
MRNIDWKFVGVVAGIALLVIAAVFYIAPLKKIVAPSSPAVG